MIPICLWISSSFLFVPCFSTLIKEKWSSPTAAQHTNQFYEYAWTREYLLHMMVVTTDMADIMIVQRKIEVSVHFSKWDQTRTSWKKTYEEASVSPSSPDSKVNIGHLFAAAAKPISIPWWLHSVKRAPGECYKSQDQPSSVFIATWTHMHILIDSPSRQIHFSLMDSLILNGPILHCLLWVTHCVFEMCWDPRSMVLYRCTPHLQRWSVFMCATV